jgi:hypothetical protein
VDHDEGPSEAGHEPPRSRSSGRRPAGSARSNARVAAAAKEALDGFQGVQSHDRLLGGGPARSPGVKVLFEPAVPREPAAPREPTVSAGPAAESLGHEPSELEAVIEASGVWNPFRQPRATPDATARDLVAADSAAARPRISHLHTRCTETEATVIATLEHGGRRAHGTAVGPPVLPGVLHAVAEATVAALRIVVEAPVPAAVDHVTLSPEDAPASVSVAVTWTDAHGEEHLVADTRVHGDLQRAVMQATLDALVGRLGPPPGPAPAASPS